MNTRALLGLLLTLFLVACATDVAPSPPSPSPVAPNLRPAGTPDVMILAFAGRCGIDIFTCNAPADNDAYLSELAPDNSASVVEAIAGAFTSQGYTVGKRSYRSHLWSDSLKGNGYVKAQLDLDTIKQTLIADFSNPTRLVLVGHSHGTNFASLLAMDNPAVTFDYFIYLDGVCFRWESDHLNERYFGAEYTQQADFPSPLNRLGEACNAYPVPDVGYADIKDVVPDNATFALEVRSAGFLSNSFFIKDHDQNTRTNGTKGEAVGLAHIEKSEGHSEITRVWSEAMMWVVGTIKLNGLPHSSLSSQSNNLQVAPIPEGWQR